MAYRKGPLISVVIPTFNRAQLLGRAIRSVLEQTYENFELIVISDACTDNTCEVVRGFDDPRIRCIRHEQTRGGSAARNTGIRVARGEYIGLLDSDDEWLPSKLEKQLARFGAVSEDLGLVYSHYCFVSDASGEMVRQVTPVWRGDVVRRALVGCISALPTILARRQCLESVGLFDEALPSCQDWDMWIRLSKHCAIDYVPESLVRVYMHGKQISSALGSRIAGVERIIQKHAAEFKADPAILRTHLKTLGALHCYNGNPREGRRCFRRAMKYGWLRKDMCAHLLMSCLSPSLHVKFLRRRRISFQKIGGVDVYC